MVKNVIVIRGILNTLTPSQLFVLVSNNAQNDPLVNALGKHVVVVVVVAASSLALLSLSFNLPHFLCSLPVSSLCLPHRQLTRDGHFFRSAGSSWHPTSVNAPSFEGTGHPEHGHPLAELHAVKACFYWTRHLRQTMSTLWVFFSRCYDATVGTPR